MATAYAWREGFKWRVKPEVAQRRLEQIRQRHNGQLRPEDIVEDARQERSPLHEDFFRYTDREAAERFRIALARKMMRSIVAVPIVDGQEATSEPIPVYVNVISGEDRYYTTITAAMTDPDSAEYVLGKARKELESFRAKYGHLEALARLMGVIDEVVTEI